MEKKQQESRLQKNESTPKGKALQDVNKKNDASKESKGKSDSFKKGQSKKAVKSDKKSDKGIMADINGKSAKEK